MLWYKNYLGTWYMYDGTHRISNKLSIKTGSQFRFYETTTNFNILLIYTGLSYHFNSKTTATIGYGYLDIDRHIGSTHETHLFENRIYEQLNYKHKLDKLPIYHRLRFENRFLNFENANHIKHRFRYRIGTKLKLNSTFLINVNNEFFANLKDDVFTENRLYSGLNILLTKSNTLQLGYMNHKINGLNLHRIVVGLFIKTDHRKKEKKE